MFNIHTDHNPRTGHPAANALWNEECPKEQWNTRLKLHHTLSDSIYSTMVLLQTWHPWHFVAPVKSLQSLHFYMTTLRCHTYLCMLRVRWVVRSLLQFPCKIPNFSIMETVVSSDTSFLVYHAPEIRSKRFEKIWLNWFIKLLSQKWTPSLY